MKYLVIILLLSIPSKGFSQSISLKQYKEDFAYFWSTIQDNYAYWDKKQTDWKRVKEIYAPAVDSITTKAGFISFLEKVFYELYDHHASLNTNTEVSQRLVPSGTDLWAAFSGERALIVAVRLHSAADSAGIRPGMQLLSFNDIPVAKAILPFLANSLKKDDKEARDFALRTLIAGTHSGPRNFILLDNGKELKVSPGKSLNNLRDSPVDAEVLPGNIGYIRFNDRLWDNATITDFDLALQKLKNTGSLILDLRETPSGGNTTVARAILGSFITKDAFFQKHELSAEEAEFDIKRSWLEIVSPRKYIYKKRLLLLVGRWTGSVGEAITIGFDAIGRATIIGTKMAWLNGANYSFTMPNTGIGFSFPAEKIFHVNGTAREQFTPFILIDLQKDRKFSDPILERALLFLKTRN